MLKYYIHWWKVHLPEGVFECQADTSVSVLELEEDEGVRVVQGRVG